MTWCARRRSRPISRKRRRVDLQLIGHFAFGPRRVHGVADLHRGHQPFFRSTGSGKQRYDGDTPARGYSRPEEAVNTISTSHTPPEPVATHLLFPSDVPVQTLAVPSA